jgi:predicted transcriptional regulator
VNKYSSVFQLPAARCTDPDTSFEAAEAAQAFAHRHCTLIMQALRQGPAGKSQIAKRCGLDGVSVARRLSELERAGLIQPTGQRVLSTTGRSEREWEKR